MKKLAVILNLALVWYCIATLVHGEVPPDILTHLIFALTLCTPIVNLIVLFRIRKCKKIMEVVESAPASESASASH